MFSMIWVMRCFVCVAFLSKPSMCQAVSEKMTAAGRTVGDCVCSDKDGRTINLLPLQRTDGHPRYTTVPALGYQFSYNPCRSFYKGLPQSSACRGDVAVCKSTANGAINQNIGRQSSARCGVDGETLPQLEYTNRPYTYPPQSIVKLKCDPTKKGENDGEFQVLDRNKGVFILSHNCACPNGCPLDEKDVPSTNPAPDSIGQKNVIMIAFSIAVAVVSVLALALLITLIILCYRRGGWQLLVNQGQPPEAPPANDGANII